MISVNQRNQREFISGEMMGVNRRNFLHGETQRNTELHRGIQREFVQINGETISVNQRNQRELLLGETVIKIKLSNKWKINSIQ